MSSASRLIFVLTAVFVTTIEASFNALISRQASSGGLDPSTIPSKCQSSCLVTSILSDGSCTTIPCECSTEVSTGLTTCLQCLLSIVGDSTAVSKCQSVYDLYAQTCDSTGHMVPNFTCASGSSAIEGSSSTSGGDSSTGLGASSSTLITPTQSSIPNGSSNSSSSDGGETSGTATDGAIQSPMGGIMVLIGVITIAISIV